MTRHSDVIVVGLGAMGAAALYQLARRGINVIGIDRFTPHGQADFIGRTIAAATRFRIDLSPFSLGRFGAGA
jgi:glycine/D-amino acid oxidase-like deaminating enzyme